MFILFEVVLVLAMGIPLATRARRMADGFRRVYAVVFLVVLGLVVAWNVYLALFVNWQWFDSKGYLEVYAKTLTVKGVMFGIGFGSSLAVLFANFRLALRTLRGETGDTLIALIAGLAIAVIMGVVFSSMGYVWLLNRHQVVAAAVDPVFGRSISYYLFTLPWRTGLLAWVTALFVVPFFVLLLAYLVSLIVRAARRKQGRQVEARSLERLVQQLLLLGAAWAVCLALKQSLNIDRIVYGMTGVVAGAGFTDLHAGIFGLRVTRILWILAALVLVLSVHPALRRKAYYGKEEKLSPARMLAIPAGLVGMMIVVNVVIPGIQQAARVQPDELNAEAPYLERNMNFTRAAYSIGPEDIEEREIAIGRSLTPEVTETNRATLSGIRLWDYRALADYLREYQEIKPYYEFHDVDVDRYWFDGELTEVMLAVRELETDQLDSRASTWVNRTFTYTHGYGLAMAPVSEFLSGGQPNLLVRNIPPEVNVPGLRIDTPQVYYGELTDTFVLTTPSVDEFDYPAGDENVYTNYGGTGGIVLDTAWKKFCFAWWLNSHQMVFSPDVDRQTRIHMKRDARTMAHRIAPWLRYDYDPYAVISGGRIQWVWDAYTVSGNYPYSAFYDGSNESYRGINYIANAAKVVIDAYDGSIRFYLFDEEDPIVLTYRRVFPSLFASASEMPPDIRAHLRYPEELFIIQLEMYGTYQMTNTQVFYTKEDVWQRAREKYHQYDDVVVEPYYITALLPGDDRPQFILMSPYTPREKNVLRSWLCACSDGDDYGRLIVYKFPKGEEIAGPRMIESRIDQDSQISQVLSLWDQGGSRVLRGNLMVVPLFHEGRAHLLYVEPVYLQAEGAKMPELKKIVLADQERIVWGDTFEAALASLTGAPLRRSGAEGRTPLTMVRGAEGEDLARILESLRTALDSYRELQGSGRFSEAGSELEKVFDLVNSLTAPR